MKLVNLALLIAIGVCNVGCNSSSVTYHNARINELNTTTPDEIYAKGNKAFKDQEHDEAIEIFEALIALHPFGRWAEDAQFKIIQSYKSMDKRKETLQEAEKFIRLYPNSSLIQQVWMIKLQVQLYEHYSEIRNMSLLKKLGGEQSERDIQHLQPLFESYNRFLEYFPNSTYKESVTHLKTSLYEKFADYQYRIAKTYFDKKAYLASFNRAAYLIHHFPETAAAQRAAILKRQSEAMLTSSSAPANA